MIKKIKELNLSKIDYATISMFLIGYLLSLFDTKIQEPIQVFTSSISNGWFTFNYVILFLIIWLSVKVLMKEAKRYTTIKPKYYPIKSLFLGYFLGFITSVSNIFVIVLFSKF